jgi:hypothetical protein
VAGSPKGREKGTDTNPEAGGGDEQSDKANSSNTQKQLSSEIAWP